MDRKTGVLELKELNEKGEGLAKFATLNVIDSDGDVTRPGAFGKQIVNVVGAHVWDRPQIGKATIFEDGDAALAEFKLNLKMPSAVEWYEALKFDLEYLQPIQQYSYGYSVNKSEDGEFEGKEVRFLDDLKVHEMSPVLVGAGVGTGTQNLKNQFKVQKIQTVLFSREKSPSDINDGNGWSVDSAKPWLKDHDLSNSKVDDDSDDEFIRFRQFDPEESSDDFQTLSRNMPRGIKMVACNVSKDRKGKIILGFDPKTKKLEDDILLAKDELETLLARVKELHHIREKDGRTISKERIKELFDLKKQINDFDTLLNTVSTQKESQAFMRFNEIQNKILDFRKTLL